MGRRARCAGRESHSTISRRAARPAFADSWTLASLTTLATELIEFALDVVVGHTPSVEQAGEMVPHHSRQLES